MDDPAVSEIPEGAQVESAIIWFEGPEAGSEFFGSAVLAGAFDCRQEHNGPRRAWPAAWESCTPGRSLAGRRVGVDVHRRCFVIELPEGDRVLLSITGAGAALRIARMAIGEAVDGS